MNKSSVRWSELYSRPVAIGNCSYVIALLLLALTVATMRADQIDDLVNQLGSTNDEDRAEAAERKAEARRSGPARRKPEPGQPVSPWWR